MEVYQGVLRSLPSRSRIGILTVRTQTWEDVFSRFDKNQSDTIDAKELQKALEGFGYNLSSQLQDLLQRKYGAGLSFELPISAHLPHLLNL